MTQTPSWGHLESWVIYPAPTTGKNQRVRFTVEDDSPRKLIGYIVPRKSKGWRRHVRREKSRRGPANLQPRWSP